MSFRSPLAIIALAALVWSPGYAVYVTADGTPAAPASSLNNQTFRNLASRAPCFHNGVAATIDAIVRHYERHVGFVFTDRGARGSGWGSPARCSTTSQAAAHLGGSGSPGAAEIVFETATLPTRVLPPTPPER
jgi:hypothetical protein